MEEQDGEVGSKSISVEQVSLVATPDTDAESNRDQREEDHMEEISLQQNFSKFSKQQLVDWVKDLANQADFKRNDSALKEIKSHFDEILEKEKSEALKRFIDEGGSPDDFEYRVSPLDAAFEMHFKVLKDRKAEHFRMLDGQKNENLNRKNSLLEELRKLVDGEDNKHSFEKFKEIQQLWKLTGAVPASHMRPLWASYHVLVDRFYDNRNIYFELKELDRRKNLESKLELCQRMEKLESVEKINDAIHELNELHRRHLTLP